MSERRTTVAKISDERLAAIANMTEAPALDSEIDAMVDELLQRRRAEARQASKTATSGDRWPALKLALWHVVTGEALNTKYVNAWDLTDKLYAAALAATSAPLPAGTVTEDARRLRQIADFYLYNSARAAEDLFSIAERIEAAFAARLAERVAVKEAAEFLLDRLEDLERGWDDEAAFREYNGHVAPAAARLRSALRGTPAPGLVEAQAKHLTEWLGYDWDSLPDDSIVDRGFPVFTHGGQFQGHKEDMRRLVRALSSITETGGVK